ncbi:MAG: MarR family transcriptional regulator [Actinomycetota bacterium]|nr:MarR family transcriptional regulator [Actinomycetota bacterium]MDH5224510.1 MarR family transcriptional regulator [Actinomycetota bacterium]MDH5313061.1 MarR family transcriptional regulator [Actinomycetota bacterium]
MPTAPPDTDLAGLASHLRLSVFRASRTLRRESHAGISPTLLAALATIDRHGPMTAGDLAVHEQVRKPTVTRILGALVDDGLVERTPDPVDGRVSWVQLTPAGRSLMRSARRRTDRFLAKRLERLDPADLAALDRAAEILDRVTEQAE